MKGEQPQEFSDAEGTSKSEVKDEQLQEKTKEFSDAGEASKPEVKVEQPQEEIKEAPEKRCNKSDFVAKNPQDRIWQGMVGCWKGIRTTPWDGSKRVELVFTRKLLDWPQNVVRRIYSSRCLDNNCVAFYYGSDTDSNKKAIELTGMKSDGRAYGLLGIPAAVGRRTEDGAISKIALSKDLNTLTFEFWNTWNKERKGPIVFKLNRIP